MYSTIVISGTFLVSALPIFWSIIVIPSPVVPLSYFLWNVVWVANTARRLEEWTTSRRGKAAGASNLKEAPTGVAKPK